MFKKLFGLFIVIVVVAQFFAPEKNEGDMALTAAFLEETNPPEEVQSLIVTSCFDCHSNNTNYPWYNSITPVNYWLHSNITDGKSHLNFSKWNDYSDKMKEEKMNAIKKAVRSRNMPLPAYTWIHHEAEFTHDQIQDIVNWANLMIFKYSMTPKPQ